MCAIQQILTQSFCIFATAKLMNEQHRFVLVNGTIGTGYVFAAIAL